MISNPITDMTKSTPTLTQRSARSTPLRKDATHEVTDVADWIDPCQIPKCGRYSRGRKQESGRYAGRQEEHVHREERFLLGSTGNLNAESNGKPNEEEKLACTQQGWDRAIERNVGIEQGHCSYES